MSFSSIKQLLQDPKFAPSLLRLLEETNRFLIDPQKEYYYEKTGKRPNKDLLNQFSFFDLVTPVSISDSFRVLQYKFRRNMSIGSVTPVGGEIPSTMMGQLIKFEGDMIKMSLSHVFDEQLQIQMIELGQSNNIPKEFVKMLFGSVNDLQFKAMKLLNVLTAQMMYQGRIRYVDPRTNAGIELEQPDLYPELYPAANTGGASWDNYSTANGLQDLIDLNNAYYQINGFYPEFNTLSREAMNHLLRQESTAAYATSAGLINNHPTSSLPSKVTRKTIKQLIEDSTELVPLKEWDAQYELEITPGQTVRARYFPSTHVVIGSERMGERILGPTIESAKANNGKPKGGWYTKTEEILKGSPPQERSYIAGRGAAWFDDSRRMGGKQVLAA